MELEETIENLELHDMSPDEMSRTVNAMSEEGMALRAVRRKIRYQLYRLQTESLGGCSAEVDDTLKQKIEDSPNFDGWRNFGVTWDVAMDDPYRIVHRDISMTEEWEALVRAKFPIIEPGTGRISYPDITVKVAMEKHQKEVKND